MDNMDNKKKVLIGACFIIGALLLVFKDYINLPNLDIPFWILIVSAVFIIGAITNLSNKNYMGAIGSIAILIMILNFHYKWINIASGTWIGAVALGLIGLQMIFSKDKKE